MTDDELKGLFNAIRQDIGAIRADTIALRADTEALREDTIALRSDTEALREDTIALRQDNATIHADIANIREENSAAHRETRRHFDVVTEKLQHEIQLIAESVVMVDEKLDRTAADLHQTIDRNASELQGLVRYSYETLGRRVKVLEET